MSLQGLITHFKTLGVQQVLMNESIYRSEFEAMKAPHIFRRRVSYMSNRETGDNRRSFYKSLLKKTNFWQNVLERQVNIALILAKCNLPFRGSSKKLSKDNKGDFLSILKLFAKYNTVLDKLLQLPKRFSKIFKSFDTK